MGYVRTRVRAKVGYIETKRRDKSGRIVKARDHVLTSQGMFSADEMEREMRQIAQDVGADESQLRIEIYPHGQAPIEANPRHRGLARRRYWSGWSPT